MEILDDVAELQEQKGNADSKGLDPGTFSRICEEIQLQPSWRPDADKCCAYYDGNQMTAQELAEFEQRGIPPVVVNLIKPTTNLLLGLEAKMRRDWRVTADGDDWTEVAEAGSAKLAEVERETYADRACSEAYASEIKAGVGWVEVSRCGDPFRYPYRVAPVHRREVFWQWQAKEPDLSDAVYLVRRRWFPTDTILAFFPDHAEHINAAWSGNPLFMLERYRERSDLRREFNQEQAWSLADMEWRNTYTRQLCLFEVWHRTYKRGYVLKLPHKTVEFDKRNPIHAMLVDRGVVRPDRAVYTQLKRSIWLGPYKLVEGVHRTRKLPYVPFWGYREDISQIPYGVIRDWLSPQDEYNTRRAKLLWLLNAKRLTIDGDALDTDFNDIDDVLRELGRPDAAVVLNANRRNANAMKVESDLGLAAQQFNVLMQDREAFRHATGLYQPSEGSPGGEAKSGVALQTLVEQGDTGYAEINDNYRFGRRLVGESILDLIFEDMAGQQVDVVVGESGKRRTISLNKPVPHPEAPDMTILENDVTQARVKVALEDVPSTPAYRQQQNMMMSEVLKSCPPNLQAVILPYWLETTDLPKRAEMSKLIRKVLGLPDVSNDPEQEQAEMQVQAQAQAAAAELQQRAAMAEIAVKEAQAMKLQAEAQAAAQAIAPDNSGAEAMAMRQEFEGRAQELMGAHDEQLRGLQEQLTQVRAEADRKVADALSQAQAARDDGDLKIVIANIAKAQAIEVANIQAAAQRKADDVTAKLKAMSDEFKTQLKAVEDKRREDELKRREQEAAHEKKEEERRRKEEDARRKEDEKRAAEKSEEKESKDERGEKPEPQPIVVNVGPIVLPKQGGAKTIEIARPDGTKVTGKVTETEDD